eukprot:scaffold22356_cov53-Attheya_sp.AAC.10
MRLSTGYLRVLSSMRIISLKNDADAEIVGFQSLENGQSYTLGERQEQDLSAQNFLIVLLRAFVYLLGVVLLFTHWLSNNI